MIRSIKLSNQFANSGKKETLRKFLAEYQRITCFFIDVLWEMENIPIFLPADITSKVSTWLSARMIQAAGKQASGIVRGTRRKQEQRLFVIKRLMKKGQSPAKLQRKYDKTKISKPKPNEIYPELSSNFISINTENNTSFDIWLSIGSIGNGIHLKIPLKRTRVLNKWMKQGTLKNRARLSLKYTTLMIDVPEPEKRTDGETMGLDIGEINTFSCSDGQSSGTLDGWNLSKINEKLARKQRGSRGFKKAQRHRENFVNWSLNQLNLSGIQTLRIEKIKDIRRGKRISRRLSHWNYPQIFDKLSRICEETGVQLLAENPAYTSQRCSSCGWTRKRNRNGKLFICGKCGYTVDSDINAAINLSVELPEISSATRQKNINRNGFYWLNSGLYLLGGEHIVPLVQET